MLFPFFFSWTKFASKPRNPNSPCLYSNTHSSVVMRSPWSTFDAISCSSAVVELKSKSVDCGAEWVIMIMNKNNVTPGMQNYSIPQLECTKKGRSEEHTSELQSQSN